MDQKFSSKHFLSLSLIGQGTLIQTEVLLTCIIAAARLVEHNIPGKVANLSQIFDANGEAAKENGLGGYGVRFVVFPGHETKSLISESSWFLFLVKLGPYCKCLI